MNYLSPCSLSELIFQIQKGELSPEKLVDHLCDKIDTWDEQIHAFLPEKGRKKRLSGEIGKLYNIFPGPSDRSELFGIPVGVKDIFRVDGFPTKAGSHVPSSVFEGNEAASVTRLKQAGALIMGKTVTTEFAYFQPGPTRNPNNFDHTPGGSSSGSAAAVAAGFCPLALGTQTIGSITRPAAYCGVFGFKPSKGRIPSNGVIPFSQTADQIGFFTQDIEGCEKAASILCDNWETQILSADQKPVFGIPIGNYLKHASDSILNEFNKKIKHIRESGYAVLEVQLFENIIDLNSMHNQMITYEFARVHKDWYTKYKELYSTPSKQLIEKGNTVNETVYENAKDGIKILREHLNKTMNKEGIDIWISPSVTSLPPKGLASTGDPAMSLPWTYVGLPTISIPSGCLNGLPFGLQLTGTFYNDEKLLAFIINSNFCNTVHN